MTYAAPDYAKQTFAELIVSCKTVGFKGYSGMKKEELVRRLQSYADKTLTETKNAVVEAATVDSSSEPAGSKKSRGQFYTTNSSYILEGMSPPLDARCIVEPFAGKGDLIEWVKGIGSNLPIEAYDIEPKKEGIIPRDTLLHPPNYADAWILTNPPYLARNKSKNKDLYDLYNTNDLYKCFIHSVTKQASCRGGLFLIPAGFFFSPRDLDVLCRHEFMTKYRITKVRYFEETVFDDTSTTIVAVLFERSPVDLTAQEVIWELLPSKEVVAFSMIAANDWIIGGEIYALPTPPSVSVRRAVEDQALKDGEQQTWMTLRALDSGTKDGRLGLTYKKDYIYPAKECSRAYATLRITGTTLSEEQQQRLCTEFNEFIEAKRTETRSLFLPQYRESKEYARKRIPFDLAYRVVLHLIGRMPA